MARTAPNIFPGMRDAGGEHLIGLSMPLKHSLLLEVRRNMVIFLFAALLKCALWLYFRERRNDHYLPVWIIIARQLRHRIIFRLEGGNNILSNYAIVSITVGGEMLQLSALNMIRFDGSNCLIFAHLLLVWYSVLSLISFKCT